MNNNIMFILSVTCAINGITLIMVGISIRFVIKTMRSMENRVSVLEKEVRE